MVNGGNVHAAPSHEGPSPWPELLVTTRLGALKTGALVMAVVGTRSLSPGRPPPPRRRRPPSRTRRPGEACPVGARRSRPLRRDVRLAERERRQQRNASAPKRTVKAAVAASASGRTIVLRKGTYHETVIIPKGKALTIQAYPREPVWFDGTR